MFFDRTGGQGSVRKQAVARYKQYPGPIMGWIKAGNLRKPREGSAEYLLNIYPTQQGGRLRRGSLTSATLTGGAEVFHLAPYESVTSKLWAATETAIFDITTPVDPLTPVVASVTGMTSGDWSSIQFTAASGGHYLMMVNGADLLRRHNGTAWLAPGDAPAITGVTTSDLSQIWSFKRRVFAIKKNSLSAYYLPDVGAIGGAFTEFPLASVFWLGGSLMFGATWSVNAGDGLQDICIFATDKGEVAAYAGTDPGSDFTLIGVYRFGVPVHKNAHFKAGGDLVIVTQDGMVPISAAVDNDRAALVGRTAITKPIEPEWQKIVRNRPADRFPVTLWQKGSMLLVGLPPAVGVETDCLVTNAVDGTWSRYTGWDVRSSCIYEDNLYFGTSDGLVKQAEVGGSDDGIPYHCVYVPSFSDFGNVFDKVATHARILARTDFPYSIQMFACQNYDVDVPLPLPPDLPPDSNLWEVGEWDNPASQWSGGGGEVKDAVLCWQTVSGLGHTLAPGLSIAIGQDDEPDFEIIGLDLQYQQGTTIA